MTDSLLCHILVVCIIFDYIIIILLENIILVLKLLHGIGILLMLFGYFLFIGPSDESLTIVKLSSFFRKREAHLFSHFSLQNRKEGRKRKKYAMNTK